MGFLGRKNAHMEKGNTETDAGLEIINGQGPTVISSPADVASASIA